MPVINGVYLKDFPALPSAVTDANIIPIAISGNQIAYRTTVAGIVTDARVTSKLLTGLSVTGSTILATDTILQAFGKVQNQLNGKVSSVGLTMPAAFNVANSPITSAGTLAVTAAGLASQYIRGDGALADFPTTGGGGSSVSYYLNGSVSQGTIGGNTYYEMNKTPVIGTGTDFSIATDGYIAQFITDANDPASLLIPGGNWNVEMYFSASSSGGTPSFYVEVYKYDGSTFTLLGSSSATPEGITNGTAIDIYYTSVGIPETVLTITDRLAIRVYVTHSGRTITLHTEDNHLSEIVTTFSNGLTALNGLTKQTQYFATGTTGTDFNISSSVDTHTFNIPSASASNRGLITTGTQTLAGTKTFNDNISVSTSTANSAIQATSTKADGRALSVLATSTLEPFAVVQNGTGKLAAFSNTSGEKFIIYNSGSFEANGATLYANLDGTTANFTGQLTLGSTITNGTYTYTLPSATGTLALTSALSSYLPLSGGTLTGALGGTSASFSSTGSFLTNSGATTTEKQIIIANTGGSMRAGVESSAGGAIQLGTLAYAAVFGNQANAATQFTTNGTARLTILGDGNVGIGTTTPSYPLHLKNATFSQLYIEGGSAADLILYNSGGSANSRTMVYRQGTGGTAKFFSANDAGTINKDNILVLDNSTGAVLLGTSTTLAGANTILHVNSTDAGPTFKNANSGQQGLALWSAVASGNNVFVEFSTETSITARGSITYNRGAGLTVYNTTSDYRLKSEIQDFEALSIINNLKPKEFRIGDAENKAIGFIAHELQEFYPQAVTGEKDEVNDEGKPKYQSVDYSQLTGLLVKAIQELSAEIDLLKGEPTIPTDNNLE